MPLWFSMSLSATLMKNWDVAECGSIVRATATLYLWFFSPLSASFRMGELVSCFFMPGSKPPHRHPGS